MMYFIIKEDQCVLRFLTCVISMFGTLWECLCSPNMVSIDQSHGDLMASIDQSHGYQTSLCWNSKMVTN